jgi:hypothetical protein
MRTHKKAINLTARADGEFAVIHGDILGLNSDVECMHCIDASGLRVRS